MSKGHWMAVVIVVSGAAVLADCLLNGAQALGAVLILGVTAAVIVWYAEETRRMANGTANLAEETRRMASSTADLAATAVRPNLILTRLPERVIAVGTYKPRETTGQPSAILNTGAGPALDVQVRRGDDSFTIPQLPAAAPAYHWVLESAFRARERVSLAYRGLSSERFESQWVFDPAMGDWRACNADDTDTA